MHSRQNLKFNPPTVLVIYLSTRPTCHLEFNYNIVMKVGISKM